ncbi:MAG: DUF1501 domain-containing protein [Paracoccaceae bacterium]|nr:DUF1501 domain-containing protein [Paracoccaceae bacterium]|tara:strand:+ start:2766 stop:3938 length:1173 start_codon:yes stop_codon:yes gene_type:complete
MNRRELITAILAGMSIPLAPLELAAASTRNGRRLILVELSGANDGLNTLVPIKDERYRELRPKIGLLKHEVFDLGQGLALHSAMKPLDAAWQAGDMAVLQGLGYPGQNRSHFKSIAIWETGGDGNKSGKTGWLTEDIEGVAGAEQLDAHGISLDGGMGVFASPSGVWLSMTSMAQFSNLRTKVETIKTVDSKNPALSLVLDRGRALDASMRSISKKIGNSRYQSPMRINAGDFGKQVSMAASLIDAGIDAPVLKLKINGFDTHENQAWRHRALLRNLAKGLSGLRKALKRSGHWEDTLVMTYSEFGRRALENESGGTDHGTAAPHFLMSGALDGGIWGIHPDLGDINEGDVSYTMDYRVVYDRVLADWFSLDQNRFSKFRSDSLERLLRS